MSVPDYDKKLIFRPATDFERDVALENIRYRFRYTADSEAKLLRLAEQEPTSPRPYEILAAISTHDKQSAAALDRRKKAAELGSTNPFVYLQLANPLVREMRTAVSLDYRIPENECAQLRAWLDRTIQLSPEYWEAYETLAFVEAFADKPRAEVIDTIQGTVKWMRDPQHTLIPLAALRWRIKDYATTETILSLAEKRSSLDPLEKTLTAELRKQLAADRARRAVVEPSPSTSSEPAETRGAESAK